MKIEYTGRQTDVTRDLRKLTEEKLARVKRALPGITSAHVVVALDRHRRIVEVTVHSRRVDLTARDVSTEWKTSLLGAMTKLERQAERTRGKWDQKKKGAAARGVSPRRVPAAARVREPEPRIIRGRSAAKPMSLDEAALEVRDRHDGVLVFRDAATERMSVLYRRKDGHFGLVDAEG